MKRIMLTLMRWLLWIVTGIFALIVLIIALLYIPPCQDIIFSKALSIVNSSDSGMHVDYKNLRLKFPLRLKGSDIEAQLPGDMEINIGSIDGGISLFPLIAGNLESDKLDVQEIKFRMGTPDSAMYMLANVDTLNTSDIYFGLKNNKVSIDHGIINGANVVLLISSNDTTAVDTANTTGTSLDIVAKLLEMRRVKYRMQMLPTIDTLDASVDVMRLANGHVDLANRKIEASSLNVDGVEAQYLYPLTVSTDSTTELSTEEATPDSLLWTITTDRIDLNGKKAIYAVTNAVPQPGFDMNYIEATDIKIQVDSFYNKGASITVPLQEFTATERCGIKLDANGIFEIANGIMSAKTMTINTNASEIHIDASMGLLSPEMSEKDCPITADIKSKFALSDIGMAFPNANDILSQLPIATELQIGIAASGNMSDVTINEAKLSLTRLMSIEVAGNAGGFTKGFDSMFGKLNISGKLVNTNSIKPSVVEAKLGKGITLHPLSVDGQVSMNHGTIASSIKVLSDSGTIALDGDINIGKELYDAKLQMAHFPIHAFMPTSGLSDLSAKIEASGESFNPLAKDANMQLDFALDHLIYNKTLISNITGNATLSDDIARIKLHSPVNGADITFTAEGNVEGPDYAWTVNGNIADFDLQKLNLSETPLGGSLNFAGDARFNLDSMNVDAHLNIPALDIVMGETKFGTKNVGLNILASTDTTGAELMNQDLRFTMGTPIGLDSLMKKMSETAVFVDSMMRHQRIEADSFERALPPFITSLTLGRQNIISSYLSKTGSSLESFNLYIVNNLNLSLNGILLGYKTPTMVVDTVKLNMWQDLDTLLFNIKLNNAPESPGDWADVTLKGKINPTSLSARFDQKDFQDKTGFDLGATAEWKDSIVTMHLIPEHPVIGYKNWTLNQSNYISLDFSKKSLNADLELKNDVSSVRLYTKGSAEIPGEHKSINLYIKDILLQDWITLNPYAPPMKGNVSGELSLFHQGDTINGDADISLANLYYGKQRVGDFTLGAKLETQPRGYMQAKADVGVNGKPVIAVKGHINDTTAAEPFMLDMRVDSFPLSVANPFLSDAGLKLSGRLEGDMKVTGSPTAPVFNGFVDFDSASVKIAMLGSDFSLSDEKIPVDSGIVKFENYAIKGANDNPLQINGTVNMHEITNPAVDLSMDAKNMQLVNTDRARSGAEIFGKAYADIDVSARGDMAMMRVNANVNVLRNTNVTYILTDATQTLSSRSQSDIVKFVNFADTTQVEYADSIKPIGMLLGINADLQIQSGATIQVYLSGDGKNRVSIQPQGSLDYTMDLMGSQRVTGRLSINSGYAQYTPPLMSEKLFNFQEGSYVAFNGDMMNPILNIKAIDNLKANVTQSGQSSRLIYFDVMLTVTGTLEEMNVKFDLSTNDDITVKNELSAMSPDQRASAAMNLLITNMYTGPGTTATSNLGGNALYSFLESQLNSWAANNIKGVDLSFGVNQYDRTADGSTSQTTSYSYRVSKSLFDNRFKIIVGGNYTTDADTDENFSQNLINDIAFEYVINKSGSMTVKLFRHTGFESILEGEVTQTGVGLTYRKRLTSLKQMFWFMRNRYRRQQRQEEAARKALEEAQSKATKMTENPTDTETTER